MLRILAAPVAVATVLVSTACASAAPDRPAPAVPDASSQPSGSAPSESAPGAPDPEPLSSTTASAGDPGVPGVPRSSGASIDDVLRLGAVASWSEQPRVIALSLPASSECWAYAAEPVMESPTRLLVEMEAPEVCEAPNDARTYSLPVPDGIDTSGDIELAVRGLQHEFTLTLSAS